MKSSDETMKRIEGIIIYAQRHMCDPNTKGRLGDIFVILNHLKSQIDEEKLALRKQEWADGFTDGWVSGFVKREEK